MKVQKFCKRCGTPTNIIDSDSNAEESFNSLCDDTSEEKNGDNNQK